MKKRITIIGLGLIGGSIGLALKKNHTTDLEVVGYSRTPETISLAHQCGAIDRGEPELLDAIANAAIVIIATPVLTIKEILLKIGLYLPSGCVVTDTASTKEEVMKWAEEYLPATVSFIGGHPMAGKEKSGILAADSWLFQQCTYCLVRGNQSQPEAVSKILEIVNLLGAKPLFIDASEHDKFVAGISHLPFLLSVALTQTTTQKTYWDKMSKLATSGYRDLTRLSSGDSQMHRDICLTNQANIISWIDDYIAVLRQLRETIESWQINELEALLRQARDARNKWIIEKNKGNVHD